MRFLCRLKSNTIFTKSLNAMDDRVPNLWRKLGSNQTNRSTPEKSELWYMKAERGWREPPGTTPIA